MDDKSYLFRLDPAASAGYNMYKAARAGGSFLDFLLKYDSKKANEGDFSSVLGGGEAGKAVSSLLANSAVSAGAISGAIKNLGLKNSDKLNLNALNFSSKFKGAGGRNLEGENLLSSLLNSSSDGVNSTYELLTAQANAAISKALNSKNLSSAQKQKIAQKYDELKNKG